MKLFTKTLMALLLVLNTPFAHAEAEEYTRREPTPVASFTLTDQDGNSFTEAQLQGHWSLLVLGFTSCPDVCPMTLMRLEAIRAQLGSRMMPDNLPQIVFIAVDQARDATVLKPYLAHFHPDYTGITGTDAQLQNLVTSIGGIYRIEKRFPGDNAYNVRHSAAVAVVNPQGEWVATLQPPFHSHRTSEFLVQVMAKSKLQQQARNEL